MKLQTVTGEIIKLSQWSGYSLNYVVQCGKDWIADVSVCDGATPANNRRHARVLVLVLGDQRGKFIPHVE